MSVTSHLLPDTRSSRAVTKAAATVAAATLALGLTAAPAAAEGVEGEYVGNAEGGHNVATKGGAEIGTKLFKLELDDGTVLRTYCIDFETGIVGGAKYEEDAWDNYPGKGDFAAPAKVHWVLQNSFPKVDVATLADESEVDGLTEKDAVAGTQAAIWHFSNDVDFGDKGNDPEVKALYDYLVGDAQDEAQSQEPEMSLSITPQQAEGTAGETVGEFLLETSADGVQVDLDSPEDVALVDLDNGEPIEGAFTDGTEFGVQVPEDADAGAAELSASISTELHMGRLFKGSEQETQTLISAEQKTVSADTAAAASWSAASEPSPSPSPSESTEPPSSPSPSETPDDKPTPSESAEAPPEDDEDDDEADGGLPVTGAALGGLVAAAVAALGAGAAVMYLSRKRRTSSIG
ncbi:thioester domain-containing protein [Streptomonospora salina]|uniref:TQXA domain-containing protein n=1 Tax=Streptomonospora salina TaxID=104205 RepID=A0A841E8K7_9ACTN|nr:thioester domain-containing protein [Streptomonospora salina]MBB5997448.1 TQXA domain-containing protein [Streptomonospora salina]